MAAVDLIAAEEYDRMVAWVNREVIDVPIAEAIAQYGGYSWDSGTDGDRAKNLPRRSGVLATKPTP